MRKFTAAVVLAAASLFTVACSSSSAGTGTGAGALNGAGGAGAATCDGACEHYLACKGTDSPANRQACVDSCGKMGLSSEQLSSFVQSDCASAVAAVEGNGTMGAADGAGSGGNGGPTGGQSGGADCYGCTWDGSSCIYLTGSGGNYFNCDAKCC